MGKILKKYIHYLTDFQIIIVQQAPPTYTIELLPNIFANFFDDKIKIIYNQLMI